jgi:hypothetical protein
MVVPAEEPIPYKAPEAPFPVMVPKAAQVVKTHLVDHKSHYQSGRVLESGGVSRSCALPHIPLGINDRNTGNHKGQWQQKFSERLEGIHVRRD